MKIVIIGGGACGASCATRLRRLDENCEITILEHTNEVSIANCGLPYYCSDVISERDKILVSNPERFKNMFNIDVRLNSDVVEIQREEKYVLTASGEKFYYDKLVLAQGANPIKPPIEGIDGSNIFTVRTLADADKIKDYISNRNVKSAVVIGGGFIGVEMAENLAHLNIDTTLVELSDQILAPVDYEVACFAQNEMRANGVELVLSDGVKKFSEKEIELASGKKLPYDIAILSIGVKPEITLASKAGLDVNRGIKVNDNMQTSDPDIFAGGDSVEIKSFVTGQDVLIPLAGPANRQGRIIADNIFGISATYKKSQGTSVLKVFDYTVAAVGYNEKLLKRENIPYWKVLTFGNSHAGYYPDATSTLYKLLFNAEGKILGAQAVGQEGVEKRIDVISSVMRNGGTVQDLLDSELCYAPPYSSAKDPVNILGMSADNVLRGLVKPAYYEDLENSYVVDVRIPDSFNAKSIQGAVNIPLAQLRNRISEIPQDKKVILVCDSGYTSYLASRILIQKGFNNVYSLMAGMKLYKEIQRNKENKTTKKSKVMANIQIGSEVLKVDACGLSCPGPIMKLAENMSNLNDGEVLEITSTDKGFYADVEAWCNSTNNTLLNLDTVNKKIVATVQKGQAVVQKNQQPANKGQTIVVFSNDLDKALAAFIIANGAKASGHDVTLFFTFWGLNVLRKSNVKVKKSFIDKMFGFMMPQGADKLTLSKMNMGGMGSAMMKWVMKNKNISTLNELISQAQAQGVKFIACQMSMDVMGIKKEELIDGVEIAGVAKYIAESSNSNSNLFI